MTVSQPLAPQPRARGRLVIEASPGPRGTALARLHQAGALRALFPRGPGFTAVTLNTSGGVTGGDSFDVTVVAGAGTQVTVTTQAAERFYRAQPAETGRVTTTLGAGAGARLHWLPQETILFDGARVARSLTAEIAADAELLIAEPMIFGRAAMGERVRQVLLSDRIDIARGGVPVFADRIRLSGDAAAALSGPGTAGGGGAQAALILISPRAENCLAPLRQLMPATGGASLIRPGVLLARIVAADGHALRQVLIPALTALGADLPRPWAL